MKSRSLVSFFFASLWLEVLLSLSVSASSHERVPETGSETIGNFRWVHPNSDAQLWEEILTSFNDELTPDVPKQGLSDLDVYRYKYLQKVGILNNSALVIVGHRPSKEMSKGNEWDEYYSAFNFDLKTRQKASIEHAEAMWKWKFHKLAKFGPSAVPDVTFTYLTCTECEPSVMFSSLYYDTTKSIWQVRSWGDGKDLWWTASDGLVVDFDNIGSGDTLSFDCVYGILDSNGNRFQNAVIRCKEITLNETGRAKIQDATVLYGLSEGQFKPRRITDPSEALALTAKVCKPTTKSWLCRLPGYMTATSGQNAALDEMFPKAPTTSRELGCFLNLKPSMTMTEVVHRCGVPDELGGSGIPIFIYHLDDGSIVGIGATGISTPLLYASHSTIAGKSSELIPAQ